ncbi:uncharacterized protein LOC127751089 [Frankliniella occidentalis]|uniref:Uncharacterized protein LOC127751089 n=1 Tax=Frankliniella occidentalis TaxID=133901 RepID=A0A9C6XT37_FRAOC|nr:uncharacterized protein LOC127751089 [Frankliniella occidentalis]
MPEEYLQRISDDLWNGHQLDISWEQIREKFRSLKRQFGQAKKGELGGQNWEHYWLMVYIFDEDLASSNMTLCPEGFNLHDQDQPVPNEAASVPLQLSPAVTEAAQSVPIIGAAAPSQEVALTKAATVNSGSNLIRQVSASDSGQCESVLLSALDWDNLLQSGSALCASPVLKPQQGILPDKSLGDNGNLSDLEMHDILALDDGILPPDFSSTLMTTGRATPSITNNLLVRSPAPKKNKRPTYIIPPRSPAKQRTPKRKQSKSSLQWDSEETTAFVQLCVLNKERLVVSNISNTTWKDLATGLQLFNVEKSWQLCRDKFQQMHSFFEGTLLPCGGILGSRKWTHYEDFCQLFDIPEDYHVVMSSANEAADSTVAASSSQGGRLWTKERVLSLISSYKDRAAHFLGSKSVMRHNVLWAQISKEVSAAANEAISWKQCRDHMSVLKQKMHDEHLKIRNTGQSPSKWEYLDAMLDIFGGTASISAPFSFGAGTAESYRARDEEVREKPRSTRTREPDPNVSNSKKGTGAQRKLVFKNRVQELQEIQVEQKDKLLSEVQRLRLIMEDTKEERSKLFSNINRRLEDIGKSFQSTKP